MDEFSDSRPAFPAGVAEMRNRFDEMRHTLAKHTYRSVQRVFAAYGYAKVDVEGMGDCLPISLLVGTGEILEPDCHQISESTRSQVTTLRNQIVDRLGADTHGPELQRAVWQAMDPAGSRLPSRLSSAIETKLKNWRTPGFWKAAKGEQPLFFMVQQGFAWLRSSDVYEVTDPEVQSSVLSGNSETQSRNLLQLIAEVCPPDSRLWSRLPVLSLGQGSL